MARAGFRRVLLFGRLGLLDGDAAIERQLLNEGVGAGFDPAIIVAGLELRHQHVADDLAGQGVGHHGLQPVADLDIDLVLVRRDDQQQAVVLVGLAVRRLFAAVLADAPGAAQLVAIVANIIALQVGDGDHDQLVGGGVLQPLQLGCQVGFRRIRQNMGVVDDTLVVEAGECRLGVRGNRREQEGQKSHPKWVRAFDGRSGHVGWLL